MVSDTIHGPITAHSEECFGPNGGSVVALLDDLAGIGWLRPLTPVTREQLQPLADMLLSRLTRFCASVVPMPVRIVADWAAARDAARDAAEDAARDAAEDAAWSAARDAAWSAARDAAGSAARSAARDAAGDAARSAAWAAEYRTVADLVDWPSPWEPLVDMWRLGCWPVGVVRGEFVVFVPPVGGEGDADG